MPLRGSFVERYGRWAVVAGASEGLGAAFAGALAARGMGLVLLARRAEVLETVATDLRARHGVDVRPIACDLADAASFARLADACSDLEVGVAIYNAATGKADRVGIKVDGDRRVRVFKSSGDEIKVA